MSDNLIQVNWDTHKQILSSNLLTLREKEIHTDVLLSCEGSFYPAHKLVLTLCSGYFAKAFQLPNTNGNLVFFMLGVKKQILESLLSFIYTGTVTIPSEEVEEMAKAGKLLQIPELSEVAALIQKTSKMPTSNDDVTVHQETALQSDSSSQGITRHHPMVILEKEVMDKIMNNGNSPDDKPSTSQSAEENEDSEKENMKDDKEKSDKGDMNFETFFESNKDSSENDFEGWKENDMNIHRKLNYPFASKGKKCFKCKEFFDSQTQLVEHFIISHRNLMKKHYCKFCQKIFRFKKTFSKHKEIFSCGRKFCKYCTYSTISLIDFKAHLTMHRTKEGEIPVEIAMNPQKKRKNFSTKALNDMLKEISSDFEKYTDDFNYSDIYDLDGEMNTHIMESPSQTENENSIDSDGKDDGDKTDNEMNDIEMNESEAQYKCSCCELQFENIKLYKHHKTYDCRLLECPYCFKVFIKEKKDMLEAHKLEHHSVTRPYICPYCLFTSEDQTLRDQHLEKHLRPAKP